MDTIMDTTLMRERTENCAALSLAFEALDEAIRHGLISFDQWSQAVEDAYRNPKSVAKFLQEHIRWTQACQGRALVNYLKQFYRQED